MAWEIMGQSFNEVDQGYVPISFFTKDELFKIKSRESLSGIDWSFGEQSNKFTKNHILVNIKGCTDDRYEEFREAFVGRCALIHKAPIE